MDTLKEVGKIVNISQEELIARGMLAFLEKEIRLSEMEIADMREKYDVASKEDLYKLIESKAIASHPAWEDYITWKNKEKYREELEDKLNEIR
ncbi:hypothetical protein [Methanobacterium petrolearium]|uniref:hypothetical protein n=1 Tax=Methanobacterium petrolearium TaxID=710190 RepID=UPI001AE50522|nr:hypothetical protein [Methanobacterium petrolearium]MBP1946311.1 hypothetical protein [Methanobacterium petrolearium]BDZ71410.1 hypothetical protein GCM10025861_19270 [Methanobacterium petrolearium]